MNPIIQLRTWLNKQPKERYIFYIGTAYVLQAIPLYFAITHLAGLGPSDSTDTLVILFILFNARPLGKTLWKVSRKNIAKERMAAFKGSQGGQYEQPKE